MVEVEQNINSILPTIMAVDEHNPMRLSDSMLRISILKERESGRRIMSRMNHAIYDGVSLEHVRTALQALYHGERLPAPAKYSRYV